jgi:hypothetical protein
MVPVVIFDQIYSFDRASLIKSIPKPEKAEAAEFAAAAEELFDRIMQMTGLQLLANLYDVQPQRRKMRSAGFVRLERCGSSF